MMSDLQIKANEISFFKVGYEFSRFSMSIHSFEKKYVSKLNDGSFFFNLTYHCTCISIIMCCCITFISWSNECTFEGFNHEKHTTKIIMSISWNSICSCFIPNLKK